MGSDWLGRSELVKNTFEQADDALGESLSSVILEGPIDVLTSTMNASPALLTVAIAYWRVLEAEGLAPDVVAGHSLGEYSALVCAGALEFSDAVRLTRLRGEAMQSAVPVGVGTMAAIIGIKDPDVIQQLCDEAREAQVLEPSAYNTMGQVVIAGHVEAVERACGLARNYRGIAKQLNVSAPFHCSLLAPAGERLAVALAEADIGPLRIPYVPNVTATWSSASSAEEIRERLVRQVSTPVLWQQSMAEMTDHGVDNWLEVGAGRTLCGLIKRFDRKAVASDFESESWRN